VPSLEANKNPLYQLDEIRKANRGNSSNAEHLDEKIKELFHMIEREVSSLKDGTKEEIKRNNKNMDDAEAIEKEYNEMRMYRVTDMHNFELMGSNDPNDQKTDAERQVEGLTYIYIFDTVILKNSLEKINARLSHKTIS